MIYVEYAVSQGPETLIEHGIKPVAFGQTFFPENDGAAIFERVSLERYAEFLSIHGSERAV